MLAARGHKGPALARGTVTAVGGELTQTSRFPRETLQKRKKEENINRMRVSAEGGETGHKRQIPTKRHDSPDGGIKGREAVTGRLRPSTKTK